jgi:glycosyl transferase, probably involved in cell wall biogenesis
MDELISVIVPVYNTEKYLVECVESLRKQTYSNIEIILVDDGSTDASIEICDEFAEKDSRIRVFHKKMKDRQLRKILGFNSLGENILS